MIALSFWGIIEEEFLPAELQDYDLPRVSKVWGVKFWGSSSRGIDSSEEFSSSGSNSILRLQSSWFFFFYSAEVPFKTWTINTASLEDN